MDPLMHLSETAKHWGDALAVGGLVASLIGWLPGATALLVALWTLLRIYECLLSIQLKRRELGK